MKFLFYIGALFINCVRSQGQHCSDGYITTNYATNECSIRCDDGIGDSFYIPLTDASFESIRNACDYYDLDKVIDAYPSQCNSVDDLVFGDSCGCSYIYCGCSQETTNPHVFDLKYYVEYECLSCTCQAPSIYAGLADGTLVYQCDILDDTDSFYDFDVFSCPPQTCSVETTEGTMERAAGDVWLKDVANAQTKCDTLCYCNGDGQEICEEGWIDIYSNDALETRLEYGCLETAADCLNEPARMFSPYYGPDCMYNAGCPLCDCGSYSLGETWYTTISNPYSYGEVCLECVCSAYADGVNYAACSGDDNNYYLSVDGDCDNQEITEVDWQCHEDYSSDTTLGALDSTTCSSSYLGDVPPPEYCEINYSPDRTGDEYDWYCGDFISLCEAYGGDDECFYYDVTYEYTDPCTGVTETDQDSDYTYCCIGDNCNHKLFEPSSCSRSTEFEGILTELYQCQSSKDVSGDLQAAICRDPVDEITCGGIEAYYRYNVECYCKAYGSIYPKLGAASKQTLQVLMDQLTSTSSLYNNAFGCSIRLQCNLESGGTVVNLDAGQRYNVYGTFLAVLVVLIMYFM